MGTYTTNKELFMPSVGEQGWGELVNGNFETIDTFLKPITVSGSTYTFTGNLVGNQSGGTINATSISNSGTSTFTGKITANGGIGTKALTATSISNSGTLTQTGTSTFTGKITANGGVNDYESRITTLEALPAYLNGTKSLNLSYSGTYAITCAKGHWNTASFTTMIPIISSPIPLTGKVSLKKSDADSNTTLYCTGKNGSSTNALTTTQTEYTVTNAYTIFVYVKNNGSDSVTVTIGRPIVNM